MEKGDETLAAKKTCLMCGAAGAGGDVTAATADGHPAKPYAAVNPTNSDTANADQIEGLRTTIRDLEEKLAAANTMIEDLKRSSSADTMEQTKQPLSCARSWSTCGKSSKQRGRNNSSVTPVFSLAARSGPNAWCGVAQAPVGGGCRQGECPNFFSHSDKGKFDPYHCKCVYSDNMPEFFAADATGNPREAPEEGHGQRAPPHLVRLHVPQSHPSDAQCLTAQPPDPHRRNVVAAAFAGGSSSPAPLQVPVFQQESTGKGKHSNQLQQQFCCTGGRCPDLLQRLCRVDSQAGVGGDGTSYVWWYPVAGCSPAEAVLWALLNQGPPPPSMRNHINLLPTALPPQVGMAMDKGKAPLIELPYGIPMDDFLVG
ncbi:hypothetical protein OsJ_26721 [Oryza sativa Japonica Group]|uniref:Uncharacterized protein n=1 Tax=Oryza sativa subsp. japonica TaxID=39947 RepID=A3BRG9_ORYSJ|nr:hypothetical protein OsJ_26721 [Oryza sativa Japonica Group]